MAKNVPKFLNDKDPWILAEDIPDSDIFFFQIPMSCFASDTSYPFLKNYKRVATHYKKFHMDFYFSERDSYQVAEIVLKALLNRPGFGQDVHKNVISWSNKLINFSKRLTTQPLGTYSNSKLWQIYQEHDQIHTKLYTYGWLPVSVDMFHNNFTKALKSYLYGICKNKSEAEQAFITLTTPANKSIVAQEREEFLKIFRQFGGETLRRQSAKSSSPEVYKALLGHSKRWGHMGYIYAGNVKPFGPEHYLREMYELKATGLKASALLRKDAAQLKKAAARKALLYKKLKVSKQYRQLFQTASDFALSKLFRRHAQLFALQTLHATLLPEIARRLGFTRYEVQFMLKGEVEKSLLKKPMSRKLLKARLKECLLYTEKNFEAVYVGLKKDTLTKGLKKTVDKNLKQLSGQTAQPGLAKGRVKIIIRAKDMSKMAKGDILVSIATDPDIVPAMKKAAAIVTEQGGITSHAAIVSRELGIPCVIGTKIATKILKDGDLVEVDANRGIVKKLGK